MTQTNTTIQEGRKYNIAYANRIGNSFDKRDLHSDSGESSGSGRYIGFFYHIAQCYSKGDTYKPLSEYRTNEKVS